MLGLDRRTIQVAWTLLLFVAVVGTVYLIRRTLMIFVLALFFSHLLSPIVDLAQRHLSPRLPRTVGIAVVYVALVGILVAIMIPLVSNIFDEAASLAGKLPQALQQEDLLGRIPMPASLEPLRPRINAFVHDRLDELNDQALPLLSKAGSQIVSGLGNLISVVLIPILSFFFLKDGTAIREAIVEGVNGRRRKLVDDIFSDLHLLLAQYMRALVILSIATMTFYFLFLWITGAPYAVLLAGVAAALEFIPVIGPLVASITILLVAAFAGYGHILWILLFLAVYRLFQDYVLNPYLMSAGVEIHPMLVLFGVLAGEQIAGVPGMFFSVPTMAALRLILIRLRRRRVA